MRKKVFISIIAIVVVLVIGIMIFAISFERSLSKSQPEVTLIEKDSWFSDFEVVGDKVNIKCYVTLLNTFDEDKKVTLSAVFPDDVKLGLLKEEKLFAKDSKGEKAEYTLLYGFRSGFYVTFVGDFGGVNMKHDRLLPEIEVTVVN